MPNVFVFLFLYWQWKRVGVAKTNVVDGGFDGWEIVSEVRRIMDPSLVSGSSGSGRLGQESVSELRKEGSTRCSSQECRTVVFTVGSGLIGLSNTRRIPRASTLGVTYHAEDQHRSALITWHRPGRGIGCTRGQGPMLRDRHPRLI